MTTKPPTIIARPISAWITWDRRDCVPSSDLPGFVAILHPPSWTLRLLVVDPDPLPFGVTTANPTSINTNPIAITAEDATTTGAAPVPVGEVALFGAAIR